MKNLDNAPRWLIAVYAAIFLDLFGFGMLIPDIQIRAEKLGAPGWMIGFILSSTFLVQLIVSPRWGKASDHLGRKPVLLLCTGFSAAGMLMYGFAVGIPMLLLSRVLSGLGGANVAVAQAVVADGTSAEKRTAAMGRIGAVITTGLIGGPILGGFVGHTLGSHWVGWIAGSCSLFGGVLLFLLVPKVEPKSGGEKTKTPFLDLRLLKSLPQVRALVIISAIAWFSLATLEGTFGRLIERTLNFNQSHFGIIFGFESTIGFLVQAYLIGWAAKRINDKNLLRGAYLLQGLGLALTPFAYLFPIPAAWLAVMLCFSLLYAVGAGLANPTINSLCSKLTPEDRQGELFGLLQGARSLGFILGPVLGGALFDWWFAAPYLLAGCVCILASAMVSSKTVAVPA